MFFTHYFRNISLRGMPSNQEYVFFTCVSPDDPFKWIPASPRHFQKAEQLLLRIEINIDEFCPGCKKQYLKHGVQKFLHTKWHLLVNSKVAYCDDGYPLACGCRYPEVDESPPRHSEADILTQVFAVPKTLFELFFMREYIHDRLETPFSSLTPTLSAYQSEKWPKNESFIPKNNEKEVCVDKTRKNVEERIFPINNKDEKMYRKSVLVSSPCFSFDLTTTIESLIEYSKNYHNSNHYFNLSCAFNQRIGEYILSYLRNRKSNDMGKMENSFRSFTLNDFKSMSEELMRSIQIMILSDDCLMWPLSSPLLQEILVPVIKDQAIPTEKAEELVQRYFEGGIMRMVCCLYSLLNELQCLAISPLHKDRTMGTDKSGKLIQDVREIVESSLALSYEDEIYRALIDTFLPSLEGAVHNLVDDYITGDMSVLSIQKALKAVDIFSPVDSLISSLCQIILYSKKESSKAGNEYFNIKLVQSVIDTEYSSKEECFLYRFTSNINLDSPFPQYGKASCTTFHGMFAGHDDETRYIYGDNPQHAYASHSLSFGSSLFGGIIYDPTACVYHHYAATLALYRIYRKIEEKEDVTNRNRYCWPYTICLYSIGINFYPTTPTCKYVIYYPCPPASPTSQNLDLDNSTPTSSQRPSPRFLLSPQKNISQCFFIPPTTSLSNLAGLGELFHPRSRYSSDIILNASSTSINSSSQIISGINLSGYHAAYPSSLPKFLFTSRDKLTQLADVIEKIKIELR